MDFELRRAGIADAQAIARVQVESWRTTYAGIVPDAYLQSLDVDERASTWLQRLPDRSLTAFVVHDLEGVFGFVCGGTLRDPLGNFDAELYAIYLLQQKQRSGAGQALTVALAAALRVGGHRAMAVWALEANLPAIRFYRKLGAMQIAQKPIEIGGASLVELALGWPTLELTLQ